MIEVAGLPLLRFPSGAGGAHASGRAACCTAAPSRRPLAGIETLAGRACRVVDPPRRACVFGNQ